jgi:hypothetical protein
MRFGTWRGMPRVLALATTLGLGLALANSAQALDFPFHTIPREVDAYDFTTGGPYMAPPIPYGHYAKDPLGSIHRFLSCPSCQLHGLLGGGGPGHNLFHHGEGDGNHGGGCGIPGHGKGCGCGHGFGHGHSSSVVADGSGGLEHGYPGPIDYGYAGGLPVGTAVVGGSGPGPGDVLSAGQTVVQPSGQSICGQPGCGVKSRHSHFGTSDPTNMCGLCGGRGCGACGSGFGHGHGKGTGCGLCGGRGCGACGSGFGHGHGKGTGCGLCGGKGCQHCLSGLASSLHGKLASLLHPQRITWFVGPGGPVPLTPGYVPYIVTTRSPRDFFSFAPMNPNDP